VESSEQEFETSGVDFHQTEHSCWPCVKILQETRYRKAHMGYAATGHTETHRLGFKQRKHFLGGLRKERVLLGISLFNPDPYGLWRS
jgi:hypothetical protein